MAKETNKKEPYFQMFMSELIGTGLLMFLGCMGCSLPPLNKPPLHHFPSLSFGLIILLIIQCFGHISGAHLNPAVTTATVIFKMLSPVMGIVYVLAQFIGAILGFALLKVLMPPKWIPDGFCSTKPNREVSDINALIIEVILTCTLILVCCGVWDKRNASKQDSTPARFGFIIAAMSMVAGPLTGCSMNTARSFAPAVVEMDFSYQWIYWIGPNMGAIIGCGLYKFVFEEKSDKDESNAEDIEETAERLTSKI